MSCPDISALQAYVERRSDDDPQNTIRSHVERCADCRELVLALSPALDSSAASRRHLDSDTAALSSGDPAAGVAVGTTIGRYVVLSRIGEGGMGVVYAAYDPNLDRKIALKLIRRTSADVTEAGLQALQARLLREAHAMARVAHPNVATIYDVGRAGEQVFVAMELIAGETLAQWLAREPRAPAAILDLFVHAGRGLAAAHSAGLVHRDFKPSNVMIGSDGRVRVLDFGLARPAGVLGEAGGSPSPAHLDHVLTATGMLVGTPAYMAPEQRAGAATDARSDQFSFCVALYEGLYGQRPYAATSTTELASQVRDGRVSAAPPDARVSSRLRAVLLRGLSPSSADRFPTMEALLAELARDPRTRLRRFGPTIAALVVVAGGGVAWRVAQHSRLVMCRGGAAKLAGVWDSARAAQLHSGFLATGKPFAETTFTAVRRRLDDFAAAWQSMYSDACEASVRGGQSEELLELRMSCLQEKRSQLAATTEIFSHADGPVVEKALPAADALGDVQPCGDVVALRGPLRVPANPTARQRVSELRQELARVRALIEAGKYNDAMKPAADLVAQADALGYAPLRADALVELALLQDQLAQPVTEKTLVQATIAAEAGRHDEAAAQAWIALVRAHNIYTQDRDAAHASGAHAQVYIDRLGDNGRLTNKLAYNLARQLTDEGKYEEAQHQMERALAAAERAYGRESTRAASALAYLAYLLESRGTASLGEAEAMSERAVAIHEKLLGATHPSVGGMLEIQAGILKSSGKSRQAADVYRRAIAILEPSIGKDHPHIAQLLSGLSDSLRGIDVPGALAAAQRSLDIRLRVRTKNKDVGYGYFQLASIHFDMHLLPQALDEIDRAIAVLDPVLGRAHPYFAAVVRQKARILHRMRRWAEAEKVYVEATQIYERGNGPKSRALGETLAMLARVRFESGDVENGLATGYRSIAMLDETLDKPGGILDALLLTGEIEAHRGADDRARPLLERALTIAEAPGIDAIALAEARLSLARSLTPADRPRARELAIKSRATYATAGDKGKTAEIDAWLRRHP